MVDNVGSFFSETSGFFFSPCQYHSTILPYSSLFACCLYRKDKGWKPMNLTNSFWKQEALGRAVLPLFLLFFKGLTSLNTILLNKGSYPWSHPSSTYGVHTGPPLPEGRAFLKYTLTAWLVIWYDLWQRRSVRDDLNCSVINGDGGIVTDARDVRIESLFDKKLLLSYMLVECGVTAGTELCIG